jgi:hypothetical protein
MPLLAGGPRHVVLSRGVRNDGSSSALVAAGSAGSSSSSSSSRRRRRSIRSFSPAQWHLRSYAAAIKGRLQPDSGVGRSWHRASAGATVAAAAIRSRCERSEGGGRRRPAVGGGGGARRRRARAPRSAIRHMRGPPRIYREVGISHNLYVTYVRYVSCTLCSTTVSSYIDARSVPSRFTFHTLLGALQ